MKLCRMTGLLAECPGLHPLAHGPDWRHIKWGPWSTSRDGGLDLARASLNFIRALHERIALEGIMAGANTHRHTQTHTDTDTHTHTHTRTYNLLCSMQGHKIGPFSLQCLRVRAPARRAQHYEISPFSYERQLVCRCPIVSIQGFILKTRKRSDGECSP